MLLILEINITAVTMGCCDFFFCIELFYCDITAVVRNSCALQYNSPWNKCVSLASAVSEWIQKPSSPLTCVE